MTFLRPLLITIAVLALLAPPASARYVQTGKARYAAESGDSDWYTVDITFVTGGELNSATRTLDYRPFSNYAVIFWSEHEASVIELSNTIICGSEFEKTCLPFTRVHGEDQAGREWDLCISDICY